jgi:hypothetical protein
MDGGYAVMVRCGNPETRSLSEYSLLAEILLEIVGKQA